ncbi:MAG: hypothetical protein MJZ35_06640 [Bacteroidaceae bacterium]|nr:hypothetical protein [Bacteroidaceae bacterium]
MKTLKYFFGSAIVLMALSACSNKEDEMVKAPEVKAITITTDDDETRTTMTAQSDGSYTFKWSAGDKLRIIHEGVGSDGKYVDHHYYVSNALGAAASKASFTFYAEGFSDPKIVKHRFYAASPASCLNCFWEADKHLNPVVEIPIDQTPSANSFDPNADILVSEMKASTVLPDNLSMKFARVGCIVRIKVTGLPANGKLTSATWSNGPSWAPTYLVEYDPVKKCVGDYEKPANEIRVHGPLNIDSDGSVVLWLRTKSGTLTDWFQLDVTAKDASNVTKYYTKHVDSASIKFTEGKIAKFAVAVLEEE